MSAEESIPDGERSTTANSSTGSGLERAESTGVSDNTSPRGDGSRLFGKHTNIIYSSMTYPRLSGLIRPRFLIPEQMFGPLAAGLSAG